MSGRRGLAARSIVRLGAACSLALGLLACHDFFAAPVSRFAPNLPFRLTLAGPALTVLGIALLAASFAGTKAAKPMMVAGSSLAGLGGLGMLWASLAAGKGAMAEGFDFVSLFALVFLLVPGLAIAAAGAVLAAAQRRSGKAAD
jgi:hypothetical protein